MQFWIGGIFLGLIRHIEHVLGSSPSTALDYYHVVVVGLEVFICPQVINGINRPWMYSACTYMMYIDIMQWSHSHAS